MTVGNRPLTARQVVVLQLLASSYGDPTVRDLARSGFGFSETQLYSIIDALSRRGLVDVTGFDGRARTFGLTSKGAEVELGLLEDDDG